MIVCSPERWNDGTDDNNQDSLSDNSLALGFPKGEGSLRPVTLYVCPQYKDIILFKYTIVKFSDILKFKFPTII